MNAEFGILYGPQGPIYIVPAHLQGTAVCPVQNCTPHPFDLISAGGVHYRLSPTGSAPRRAVKPVGMPADNAGVFDAQVSASEFGPVQGLPAARPGVILIVSGMVIDAPDVADRTDLRAPDGAPDAQVRDSQGRIIGIRRLRVQARQQTAPTALITPAASAASSAPIAPSLPKPDGVSSELHELVTRMLVANITNRYFGDYGKLKELAGVVGVGPYEPAINALYGVRMSELSDILRAQIKEIERHKADQQAAKERAEIAAREAQPATAEIVIVERTAQSGKWGFKVLGHPRFVRNLPGLIARDHKLLPAGNRGVHKVFRLVPCPGMDAYWVANEADADTATNGIEVVHVTNLQAAGYTSLLNVPAAGGMIMVWGYKRRRSFDQHFSGDRHDPR